MISYTVSSAQINVISKYAECLVLILKTVKTVGCLILIKFSQKVEQYSNFNKVKYISQT